MAQDCTRAAATALLETRRNPPSDDVAFGTERVDIVLEGAGNGPFACRKKDWRWAVDEPPERGGENTAPNPLAFFLSGSATCLLSHYMLCALSEGVHVDLLELTARMRFHRALSGGRITEVIYDLNLRSNASRETILELAEHAEDACYAHNTLAAAGTSLTTNLRLNDEPLATLTVPRTGAAKPERP